MPSQNTLSDFMKSLLLPFHANVDPFLAHGCLTVLVTTLCVQLTLTLTSTTRQVDQSNDYLWYYKMQIGRTRCCAF